MSRYYANLRQACLFFFDCDCFCLFCKIVKHNNIPHRIYFHSSTIVDILHRLILEKIWIKCYVRKATTSASLWLFSQPDFDPKSEKVTTDINRRLRWEWTHDSFVFFVISNSGRSYRSKSSLPHFAFVTIKYLLKYTYSSKG